MPKYVRSRCRTIKQTKPIRKSDLTAAHGSDLKISYRMLLHELDRRTANGWRPDDDAYFAELVFNLWVNQYASERVAPK